MSQNICSCKAVVSVDGKLSSSFSLQIGVHQGSALSPLLYHGNGCLESRCGRCFNKSCCMQTILFCVENH